MTEELLTKTITCVQCGETVEVEVRTARGKPRKLCSPACKAKWFRATGKKPEPKPEPVVVEQPQGELTPAQKARRTVLRNRAKQEAELEAELEAWARQWCPRDHRTWASKASCLWPGMEIVGEGRWAVWHPSWGREVRLYGTVAEAQGEHPGAGAQIVELRRGLHKRGKAHG